METFFASIITGIVTIIGSYLVYRNNKHKEEIERQKTLVQTQAEENKAEITQQTEFINQLIRRVETLEKHVDDTRDAMVEDVRNVSQQYEVQIKSLKLEMQRLRDDSTVEISVWRDRYFKLIEDFYALKKQYAELQIENLQIRSDLKDLELEYQKLVNLYRPRTSPDISQTS